MSPLHPFTPPSPARPAIAAALLAVALYAVTLRGTWVYDDAVIAKDDARLHHAGGWVDYLRQGYFEDSVDHLWRPLTSLTFLAQWKLHGEAAWAFHAANVLLYAACCAAVAELARRLAPAATASRTAYVAGLLFAALPVHVEAVAYLVGRAESLATLGLAGGLILFAKRPLTVGRAWGIFGCFVLAVGSKEHGLLLPPLLLAWALLRKWVGGRATPDVLAGGSPPARSRSREMRAGLFLAFLLTGPLAAYVLYRDSILPWYWEASNLDYTINPLVLSTGPARWLIPVSILGRYAALLIAPVKLSPDYGLAVFTPQFDPRDPYFYAGLAALALFAMACVVAYRRRSVRGLFCLTAAAVTYALVANVMLIGTVFGERLIFVPSVFVCVLVAFAAARLPRRAVVAGLLVVLPLMGLRVVTYAARWHDEATFYYESLREQPRSAMLYLLYEGSLKEQDRYADAEALMATARQNAPGAWRVWAESAALALHEGQLDQAYVFARRGFDLRVGNAYSVLLLQRVAEARATHKKE